MEKIPETIHPSWHEYLQPLFDDPKMKLIKERLLPNCKFYPEGKDIFNVFKMPISAIKVVILGQDPYFNGSAIGYAFAVSKSTPYPKSLDVILKEVIKPQTSEEYVQFKTSNPEWKTLQHWRDQGVFLLNTALTTEVGEAGKHIGQWQWFTREVISIISRVNPCIWMLWGAKAQGFKDYIADRYTMNSSLKEVLNNPTPIGLATADLNYILECPHPAAGAYSGGKTTFEGCNHFEICNQILERQKKSTINWK